MKRFLAIVRRIFGWGTIFFLLGLFLCGIKLSADTGSIKGFYSGFFVFSPILYLLFAIISVAYVRKKGQFAAVFQEHSPVENFFKCLGTDLAAPFKNIGGFFGALFNKNAMGRGLLIGRFIEMIGIILFCGLGVLMLM